jgi:hypothetical protein
MDGEAREFSVGVGKRAHERHQFCVWGWSPKLPLTRK